MGIRDESSRKKTNMPDKPVRVLIVDDSAFMRKALRDMLDSSPFIEVIDTAHDGWEALEKIQANRPDVVSVDLFMPGMDGTAFIREQMKRSPLPIVICSSTVEGGDSFIRAMEAGAVEFVQKPTARALDSMYNIRRELTEAVLVAASIPQEKLNIPEAVVLPEALAAKMPNLLDISRFSGVGRVDAVLIGVSTGGPRALRTLLPMLPAGLPVPVVIALHIPPGYTQQLAERLNELSQVEVVEAVDGMELKPGRVILARSGLHIRLERGVDGRVCAFSSMEPRDSLYIPSVDELFHSGALAYHDRLLGVVLTGMGNDGTSGAAWIKTEGGLVFVESETTSVVYGMPRSVVEAGFADRILPLEEIPNAILEVIV